MDRIALAVHAVSPCSFLHCYPSRRLRCLPIFHLPHGVLPPIFPFLEICRKRRGFHGLVAARETWTRASSQWAFSLGQSHNIVRRARGREITDNGTRYQL